MRAARASLRSVFLLAALWSVITCAGFGQTAVWTGLGANDNYTNPANW